MKLFLLGFLALAAALPADPEAVGPVDPVELVVTGVEEGEPLDLEHVVNIQLNKHLDGQLVASSDLLYPLSAQGLAEAVAAAPDAIDGVVLPSPATPEVHPELPESVALPSPATPEVVPEAVVLPSPATPEVHPEVPDSVVLPSPATPEVTPEVPDSVVLPGPATPEVNPEVPESIVLPSPATPEVVPELPESVVLPSPATPEVFPEAPAGVVLPSPAAPEVSPEVPESVLLPGPATPEVVPEAPAGVALPSPAVPEVVAAPQVVGGEVYNDGVVQVTLNLPQEQGVLATLSSWLSVVYNYIQNGIQTTQQIV